MTNKNKTDVTLVIDRSGSMQSIKADAEGGVNAFVDSQRKIPGECVVSLVQFDDRYESVWAGISIGEVGQYTLIPRGSTALLDAVGKAIVQTGERLSSLAESDRPGLVIFVIVTDGEENCSKEYTRSMVRTMIETQTNAYKWQFTFLGANQDAFAEAANLGIAKASTANCTMDAMPVAFSSASSNVTRMRGMAAAGVTVQNCYTDEERDAMVGKES